MPKNNSKASKKKIIFFINGKKYYTKNNISINDLIKYFNYDSSIFILEYNSIIYNKKKWSNHYIKNNDKIEIISIVGGG